MSLFGAMNAGVSGLASQSSAMAAIADNITNVNTVGYKGTTVDFQTLVTSQASNSTYTSGGVQSRPRTGVDVQGLLQSSTSANDLAIWGDGFFLVNEASEPGTGDQFLFSRAGSFSADDDGYLKNTGGYYLQAWPTDRSGNVVLPSSNAGLTNQNIISSQFLETVNLNRVGGTADETTSIAIGANLPANDSVGSSHNMDVQFFDTLGNTNAAAFSFSKTATNQWDLSVQPPAGTAAVTLYDSAGQVYRSIGQLEFSAIPTAGTSVDINGTTYTFGGAGNVTIGLTVESTVTNLINFVNANPPAGGLGDDVVAAHPGNAKAVMFTGGTNGGGVDLAIDASGCSAVRQSVLQTPSFTVSKQGTGITSAITFSGDGLPATINVSKMAVQGFVSGASTMDDITASQIDLDFGTIDAADGMTQLSAAFTPNFIEQDGARFGVFSGVTISSDGLVSALFDNSERRPIYRIPLVTFDNPDGLEGRSGDVWSTTEASGNPTLRTAENGPAGKIVQSSLEASTVDIGQEFTNMIVVQRAYSAATKIISTADEMLDELVNLKR